MTKNRLKSIAFVIAGLLCVSFAQAQHSVNASGGDASGSGGTIAYSIGQVFYTTNRSNAGIVSQGVQHAYEIYSFGSKDPQIDVSLKAFPNPTTGILTLEVKGMGPSKLPNLNYQVYDIQGRILRRGGIEEQRTQIDFSSFSSATYFIYVTNQNNRKIRSFKIIKN